MRNKRYPVQCAVQIVTCVFCFVSFCLSYLLDHVDLHCFLFVLDATSVSVSFGAIEIRGIECRLCLRHPRKDGTYSFLFGSFPFQLVTWESARNFLSHLMVSVRIRTIFNILVENMAWIVQGKEGKGKKKWETLNNFLAEFNCMQPALIHTYMDDTTKMCTLWIYTWLDVIRVRQNRKHYMWIDKNSSSTTQTHMYIIYRHTHFTSWHKLEL